MKTLITQSSDVLSPFSFSLNQPIAANRLIRVTSLQVGPGSPAHTSEFTYDGLWRRVRILEKQGVKVVADRKLVWNLTCVSEERDASNAVDKRFYGQGVHVLTGSQAGTYQYQTDHQGSIRNILDGSGVIVASYDYDLWGARTRTVGNFDADFGYAGYFDHHSSGLEFTLYRAYSPLLGRWINRDPVEENGGINLYSYVGNAPIGSIDPLGLATGYNPRYPHGYPSIPMPPGPSMSYPAEWVLTYGNWAGPNWSGGWRPSSHGGQDGPKPPIDDLDHAAMIHDHAYEAAGVDMHTPNSDPGKYAADKALAAAAKDVPYDFTGSPYRSLYKWFVIALFDRPDKDACPGGSK